LWRGGFSDACEHICLVCKRPLERKQIGKLARPSLPYGFRAAKITMLFEESETKAGLTRDRAFSRLLRSRNQPEERGLSGPIPAQDCPSLSLANRKGYALKYPRRAEFDAGIRD
jgi:hypothetical protein